MPETTLLKQVRKLKKLLENPDHWTQSQLSTTHDSLTVLPNSRYASCFCLVGGIAKVTKVTGGDSQAIYDKTRETMLAQLAASTAVFIDTEITDKGVCARIYGFNDGGTHDDVMFLIDMMELQAEMAGV